MTHRSVMCVWRCRQILALMVLLLCVVFPPHGHTDITMVSEQTLVLCDTCQVLILGESHQKVESPALYTDLVTHLLEQGERIFVGLEITFGKQQALDAVMEYRKFKRHFSASTSGTQPLRTPLCPPALLADGHPSLAAMAATPARRGSPPQRLAARRSAAQRSLDMPLRIG